MVDDCNRQDQVSNVGFPGNSEGISAHCTSDGIADGALDRTERSLEQGDTAIEQEPG